MGLLSRRLYRRTPAANAFRLDLPVESDEAEANSDTGFDSDSDTDVEGNPGLRGDSELLDLACVRELDLTAMPEAREQMWRTGRLPGWLRHLTRLERLRASQCGLVVLEPWLLELQDLKEIYVEYNAIETWPWFLVELKNLMVVAIQGNPCLELAFAKDNSLREAYFHFKTSHLDVYKSLPSAIRGPEWPVAAVQRLQLQEAIPPYLRGFYCGGIYTHLVRPDPDTDGVLTVLEPNSVEQRRGTRPPPLQNVATPSSQSTLAQSRVVIGTLSDIWCITKGLPRHGCAVCREHHIPGQILGMPSRLLEWREIAQLAKDLLVEEETYVAALEKAEEILILRRKKGSIPRAFQSLFDKISTLSHPHRRYYKRAFSQFAAASAAAMYKDKEPSIDSDSTLQLAVRELSTALFYGRSDYIELGDLMRNVGRSEKQVLSIGGSENVLARLTPSHTPLDAEMADFIRVPVARMRRIDRVFRMMALGRSTLEPLTANARLAYVQTESGFRDMQRNLRTDDLAAILHRDVTHLKEAYLWDALVVILGRTYLEAGILALRTNDVVDPRTNKPRSCVRGLHAHRTRKLRLVAIANESLQVWSVSPEVQLIGSFQDVRACPVNPKTDVDDAGRPKVRILFPEVDETNLIDIEEFVSIDSSQSGNIVDEFVHACNCVVSTNDADCGE